MLCCWHILIGNDSLVLLRLSWAAETLSNRHFEKTHLASPSCICRVTAFALQPAVSLRATFADLCILSSKQPKISIYIKTIKSQLEVIALFGFDGRQAWQGILMPLLPCHVFHLQTVSLKRQLMLLWQCNVITITGGKWGENDNNIAHCNNTQPCAAVANNTAKKGLPAHACWDCWGLMKLWLWTDNDKTVKKREEKGG